MKKTMKRLAITTIALFAILGVSGTIAYASGYITWAGTADYQQTLVNLDLIAERGEQLKTDKQNLIDIYVERSTEFVNEINSLEQQIEVLEKRIAEHENTYRENEQLQNVIKDKENQIDSLNQQIEALEKRIESGQTTQNQLKQAEKDMRDVQRKSAEVLEGLQND